ncbi:hypothetical protein GCM10020220_024340 [Nonomuraea rubra]
MGWPGWNVLVVERCGPLPRLTASSPRAHDAERHRFTKVVLIGDHKQLRRTIGVGRRVRATTAKWTG